LGQPGPLNLVRDMAGNSARVSVDSSFPGYVAGVLVDGKWVAPGEEQDLGNGSPDTLGNSGNTWVSAAQPAEHWVRLDWERTVTLNEIAVWWTKDDWRPQAFRVEYLSDESWVPLTGEPVWYRPTERRSALTFAPREVQVVRLIQHAAGGPDRGFLAAQEVLAFLRTDPAAGPAGVRRLTAAEAAQLAPMSFERNLARLDETQPGAAAALAYLEAGATADCPALADGRLDAAAWPEGAVAAGVQWPIQHVLDGADLHFTHRATPAAAAGLRAEYFDGRRWVRDIRPEDTICRADARLVKVLFRPVATTGFRVLGTDGASRELLRGLTELEVNRYVPATPSTWPAHLTDRPGLGEERLAAIGEPAYEALASQTLSMIPAHALLGLKDLTGEIGVAWDGTVVAAQRFHVAVGKERLTLARYRDTVTRKLIDGWRPGVITSGRMEDLALRQTAFVFYSDRERTRPALFLRVDVTNLGPAPFEDTLTVRCGHGQVSGSALVHNGQIVLAAAQPPQAGAEVGEMRVPLSIPPGDTAFVDFAAPHTVSVPVAETAAYPTVGFDAALAGFRAYWDDLLAPAMQLKVPEDRVNRMYRAVLTQLFINADGDIMPYGSAPSVYDGNLYGVEESFAMLALAYWGYFADAQRYMDATYLTPEFLKKVPDYKVYADRHQQYRNGLQPHYATTLFRFCRDRGWIEKHLQLMRDCAEWTMAQRRTTMQEEGGEKPLHWGMLPKWSYGGDIAGLQCYALYANFACWRGLRDTAWLLAQLGDTEASGRYATEADVYRGVLDRAVEGNYQPDHKPPFLPLQLYATEPVGDDYHQLFAGILLDLLPFTPGGEQERMVTDFLEQNNLLFCGLPRFRRDVGAGGLDGLYGLGYVLSRLHQGRTREFLLGFYGFLAYNLERDTFASRETNLLYASDLHVRSAYKVPDMSDPIPCSSAVALHYLRHMLLTEEVGEGGMPSGDLRLLAGVPRAWLADGERIEVAAAPTQFGEMSMQVRSEVAGGRITATITPPGRDPWREIHLRLPHPEGARLKGVSVNGADWDRFDPAGEIIALTPAAGRFEIVARY
jgi:hypothetical protein